MTQSMYVPGTLAASDRVLVDVGTGYYVEKSVPEAESFFQRKVRVVLRGFGQGGYSGAAAAHAAGS